MSVTDPVTEADWDRYVRIYGRQFAHCLWLSVHERAPKPKKKTTKRGVR